MVGIDGTRDGTAGLPPDRGLHPPGQPLPVGGRDDARAARARRWSQSVFETAFAVTHETYSSRGRHGDRAVPRAPRRRSLPTTTRRASSPATAASPSPRRRRGRRRSPRGREAGGLYAVAGLRGGDEEGEAVAPGGAAGAQAERVRRLPRRGRPSGGDRAGRRAIGWPSAAARTAACWSAPRSPSGPTCAGPSTAPSRCSTWSATRSSSSPGCGPTSTAIPTSPRSSTGCSAYSPYHHVREGVCYPAVLLTTAEGDSRVDPLHARKMAAAAAVGQRLPARPPDPAAPGEPGRSRPGQAAPEAGRRARRRAGLLHVAARRATPERVTHIVELRIAADPEAWRAGRLRPSTARASGRIGIGAPADRPRASAVRACGRGCSLGARDGGIADVDGLPTDSVGRRSRSRRPPTRPGAHRRPRDRPRRRPHARPRPHRGRRRGPLGRPVAAHPRRRHLWRRRCARPSSAWAR